MSAIPTPLEISNIDYEALMQFRRVSSMPLSGHGLEIKRYHKHTSDERSRNCLRTASFNL
jgi:hypothetical protein